MISFSKKNGDGEDQTEHFVKESSNTINDHFILNFENMSK